MYQCPMCKRLMAIQDEHHCIVIYAILFLVVFVVLMPFVGAWMEKQ